MTAYKITELNHFMSKLLKTDCFDMFLLQEAVITTYNTFTIDGRLEKDFFTREEWEEPSVRPYDLSRWADIRAVCFSLIRGKKTPTAMKFVLPVRPDIREKLIAASETKIPDGYVKDFVLTIRYDGTSMTCITGVSITGFLPDKTPERLWDETFRQFLVKKGIAFETQ